MIDIAAIQTETDLANVLERLGFVSDGPDLVRMAEDPTNPCLCRSLP